MTNVTWILVADRGRAVLQHALPDGLGPFPTIATLVHVEGRQRTQDHDSDAGGRVTLHGGARSALEPHDERWLVEARVFARQIADALDRERQQNRFDRLIVVAPPAFLGVLRDTLPNHVQERIVSQHGVDLMRLSETDRQQRLETLVQEIESRLPLTRAART